MIVILNAFHLKMSIKAQVCFSVFVILMIIVSVSGFRWFNFGNKVQEGEILNVPVPSKGTLEETRKKKKGKFTVNFILALFIIKSFLLPIAFKVMAVMSSVSVVLSTMSLIVSSLIGYAKVAEKSAAPVIKFIQTNDPWGKDDNIVKGFVGAYENLAENNEIEHDGIQPLEHYHYY